MYLRGKAQLKRLGRFLCSLCENVQTLAAFYSNLWDIDVSDAHSVTYATVYKQRHGSHKCSDFHLLLHVKHWSEFVTVNNTRRIDFYRVFLRTPPYYFRHDCRTHESAALSIPQFTSRPNVSFSTRVSRCTCMSVFRDYIEKLSLTLDTQIKTDDVYGFKITLGCVVSCESREKRTQRCWLVGGDYTAQLYETFTFDYIHVSCESKEQTS